MSGEGTALDESVMHHTTETEAPQDVSGEQLSPQEKIAYDACAGLAEKYKENDEHDYRGAYLFGTPGGHDIDLRLYFTTLPEITEQEEIRKQFQELGIGPVDIYFVREEEIKQGKVDDTLTYFTSSEDHLREGFNPHDLQVRVGDTSLFSVYILATSRKFYEVPGKELPNPDKAIDNLVLTREGAIAWSHYYTGAFLDEYRHFYENDTLNTVDYQQRLAKFVSRVTLGSALAQLDPDQLAHIKPALISAIQKADQNTSTDELMVDTVVSDVNAGSFVTEETRTLLQQAGSIRSNPAEFDPDFVKAAERALFYHGYQQGIERRLTQGQEVDYLTSYALEMLVEEIGELKEYKKGDKLVTQGEGGQLNLFYVPLRGNKKGVKIEIETISPTGEKIMVEREETPGNLVGETAMFTDRASETAIIQEDGTKVWAIDVATLAHIFTDPAVEQGLREKVLSTEDARTADILLQYFSRDVFRLVRESFPYTNLLNGPETHELLTEDNPLVNYYLGDQFHDILQTFVDQPDSFVNEISAEPDQDLTLFEQGQINEKFYIVSGGEVKIHLDSGEDIVFAKDSKGITFGESAFLGLPTKGRAELAKGGRVLEVDVKKFLEFTQSHKEVDLPEQFQGKAILPRHLLYGLAAIGYGRLRRRLATQQPVGQESFTLAG